MQPILTIAVKAARRAGDIILRYLDRADTYRITEKNPNDFVTEIDQAAERDILDTIWHHYPDHGILAEESGFREGNDYTWIVDPLDGTTNFINGYPHFAVSIAIKYRDRIEHGVIYDPIRQEIFTGSHGRGAYLNDRRMRVTQKTSLSGSIFSTGFPYDSSERMETYLQTLCAMARECGDIRRSGSAALDLAYVAAGRTDGYWEFGLKPWDLAAGTLFVREAGGLVTDPRGGETYMQTGNVMVGNLKLMKKALQLLHPVLLDKSL